MTTVATSREAYDAIQPKLGKRQTEVYEALKVLGRASREGIADHLGWPINKLTGRVKELKELEMIETSGVTLTKSGCSAELLAVSDLKDKKLKEMDCV